MSQHLPRIVIAVFVAFACADASNAAESVQVRLHDQVAVTGSSVTIGDIAVLQGGSPEFRRRVGELDLDRLDRRVDSCRVTRRQVEVRMLLAGYGRNQFTIDGAEATSVRGADLRLIGRKLESLFATEIARQFGFKRDDIHVRLLSEQQIPPGISNAIDRPGEVTVILQPSLPVGETVIEIQFGGPSQERFNQTFKVRVILSAEVAVAKENIPRGAVVIESMFQVIKRPLSQRLDFIEPARIVGRVSKREIGISDVILNADLSEPRTNRSSVITRSELLDVVIRMNQAEVRLKNAKALSSGNVGDTIVVLNPETKKQFNATVVGRNLAQVTPIRGMQR